MSLINCLDTMGLRQRCKVNFMAKTGFFDAAVNQLKQVVQLNQFDLSKALTQQQLGS